MSAGYDHGVTYTPSAQGSLGTLTVKQLDDPELGIEYVRIQWTDLINNTRCRVVPVSYFKRLLQSARPGVGVAKAALGLVYLMCAEGFPPFGEYLYVPDVSTLRLVSFASNEAVVLGWFHEKTPYPGVDNKLTVEVPLCPRSLLKRLVSKAFRAGLEFLVGFESEFILLKSTKPVEASNYHSFSATDGFLSGSTEAKVLREIADGVQKSGIELQMYHPEAAPGQYEVVTGPLSPLEAADALIHTREIIRNVSAKHGLRATFAPRVYLDSAGSSAHTHISVHAKNNIKKPDQISPLEASFLAGVLDNLPALTALTLPSRASYKRMLDGVWSGGTYVNWGTENREAPVRLSNSTSPSSRNFECRFVDGTASPYLALAGIIGVGAAAVSENKKLTVKDCPGPLFAAQLSEQQRKDYGITTRMSLTWEESRQRLAENKLLKDILGEEFTTKYLSVNKTLDDALAQDGDDEKAALTRLVEFY